MRFSCDSTSRAPIYRQLIEQVREAVARGRLAEGERLPSVRQLSKELVVNPNTIARAYTELEREGVIPGAFHCPRGMLEFWIDPESPYHKDVFASGKEFVFYCNGAWRSALATDVAQQMGLPRVVEMDGGFTAWKNAGFPVADRAGKKSGRQ